MKAGRAKDLLRNNLGSRLSTKLAAILVAFFALQQLMVPVMAEERRAPSAESIKAEQEQEFARRVERIRRKDATQDASDAKALGFPFLLGYFAGRSTETIVPGVDNVAYEKAKDRCPVLMLDGFGDAVYGANHMEYRKLMTAYATEFNAITFKACQQQ